MKYLTLFAVCLMLTTSVFAAPSQEEIDSARGEMDSARGEMDSARGEMENARGEMENARKELERAREEFDVEVRGELEIARRAMDQAAKALAEVHVKNLDGLDAILDLKLDGDFSHGPRLGLIIGSLSGEDDDQTGVNLIGVTPGSGAQKAGLVAGDRIVRIGGVSLKKLKGEDAADALMSALEDIEDGQSIKLSYERDGKTVKTEAVASVSKSNMWSFISQLGNIESGENFDFDLGFDFDFLPEVGGMVLHGQSLELSDIDEVMGHYFGVKKGVLVLKDQREEKSFAEGDIIKTIDGDKVESAEQAYEQLGEGDAETHKVKVLRKGRNKNLEIAALQQVHIIKHRISRAPDVPGMKRSEAHEKVIVRSVGGDGAKVKKIIQIEQEAGK